MPVVPQSKEILTSALKRAARVGPTKGIKNEVRFAQERSLAG